MDNTTFGPRLRALRLTTGYTQEELGVAIGVAKQHISRWEKGENFPGIESLIGLSKKLGVSVDYLCFGDAAGEHVSEDFLRDLAVLFSDPKAQGIFHELLRQYKSDKDALLPVLKSLTDLTRLRPRVKRLQ